MFWIHNQNTKEPMLVKLRAPALEPRSLITLIGNVMGKFGGRVSTPVKNIGWQINPSSGLSGLTSCPRRPLSKGEGAWLRERGGVEQVGLGQRWMVHHIFGG